MAIFEPGAPLTVLAAAHVEELASRPELCEAVGSISAQWLAQRAATIRNTLAAAPSSADALLAAVLDLARDCVTLPDWVEGSFEADQQIGGDLIWTFGPVVAEAIADSLAAVAGLTEDGLLAGGVLVERSAAVVVLEDLSRELDYLAPYLFGSLCRADEVRLIAGNPCETERLLHALCRIYVWALTALLRLLGCTDSGGGASLVLAPEVLWEWASRDHLWVLVIAKGVLTLKRPSLEGTPAASALEAPPELQELQIAVASAVMGLTLPSVAFAAHGGAYDGRDMDIAERAKQLVQHRAHLAAEVALVQLLGPLVEVVSMLAVPDLQLVSRFAIFLVALLQPEIYEADPPWAFVSPSAMCVLLDARGALGELQTTLSWHARSIWDIFANTAASGHMPRGLLSDCCHLAFASQADGAACLRLLQGCLAFPGAAEDPGMLSKLCILLANAGLWPSRADPRMHFFLDALAQLPAGPCAEVSTMCADWRGPVRKETLEMWLALLGRAAPDAPGPQAPAIPQAQFKPQNFQRPPSESTGLRHLLSGAPEELRCALDQRLVVDPVRAPAGLVYERSVLAAALQQNGGLCPCTGQPLDLQSCVRDAELRKRSVTWIRSQQHSSRPAQRGQIAAAAAKSSAVGEASWAAADDLPNFDVLFA